MGGLCSDFVRARTTGGAAPAMSLAPSGGGREAGSTGVIELKRGSLSEKKSRPIIRSCPVLGPH